MTGISWKMSPTKWWKSIARMKTERCACPEITASFWGQGRVPACATKAATGLGKPRAHGNRLAQARAQGTHHEIGSAHRRCARDDRRACGNESADANHRGGDRFFRHQPQDQAVAHAG